MKTTINFYLRPQDGKAKSKTDTPTAATDSKWKKGRNIGLNRSEKETPVLCFFSVSGKVLDEVADRYKTKTIIYKLNTGIKVKFSEWDAKRQQPKDNRPDKGEILNHLAAFGERVTNAVQTLLNQGVLPTIEQIKAAIVSPDELMRQGTTQPETPLQTPTDAFYVAYADFLDQYRVNKSPLTVKKFKSLLVILKEYAAKPGVTLSFEALNLRFIENFQTFLITRTGRGMKHAGMLNNTVNKYIVMLKTFIRWSYDREYHTNRVFEKMTTPATAKLDIVSLTESELMHLYGYDFSDCPRLERARDRFCFSAFTGQRWSDVNAFSKSQLIQTLHYTAWEFEPIKTPGKRLVIPFMGFIAPALTILQKYNYVFPAISAGNFNAYIKEACQVAGLDAEVTIKRKSGNREIIIKQPKWEFVTSHTARRTFVTVLLEGGMRPLEIMKFTGHSDIKTLMKYENTSHESAIAALERFSAATDDAPDTASKLLRMGNGTGNHL